MNGGPSQTDTFDLNPGHDNGGPFTEVATAVPGTIRVVIAIRFHVLMMAIHQITRESSAASKCVAASA